MTTFLDLFNAGNNAQLEKLQENVRKKSGFDDIDIDYALDRILDEFIELRAAVSQIGLPDKTKLRLIRREAADVANYAHMIILKCDKLLTK